MPFVNEDGLVLMDSAEAALYLGVSKEYLRHIAYRGFIKRHGMKYRALYSAAEVKRYKRNHPDLGKNRKRIAVSVEASKHGR